MKNSIYLLAILTLFSCSDDEKVVMTDKKSPISIINETLSEKDEKIEKKDEISLDYSNPAYMMGSTFGNIIQMYYKIGEYEKILSFTSKETIEKFGKDKLIEYYKTMDFGYKINLKSINYDKKASDSESKYMVLNYESEIIATRKMIRINAVLENDTVKLVLNNINNENPFLP